MASWSPEQRAAHSKRMKKMWRVKKRAKMFNLNYIMDKPTTNFEQEPKSALQVQEGGGHYKDMKIQPIEFIHANNIPFPEGSVIKYVSRWRKKNGVADLRKARHFLDLLIELEEKGR